MAWISWQTVFVCITVIIHYLSFVFAYDVYALISLINQVRQISIQKFREDSFSDHLRIYTRSNMIPQLLKYVL